MLTKHFVVITTIVLYVSQGRSRRGGGVAVKILNLIKLLDKLALLPPPLTMEKNEFLAKPLSDSAIYIYTP